MRKEDKGNGRQMPPNHLFDGSIWKSNIFPNTLPYPPFEQSSSKEHQP